MSERRTLENGEIVVEDSFGSTWLVCNKPYCDLQVVRPGKVQCNGQFRGGCGHDESD